MDCVVPFPVGLVEDDLWYEDHKRNKSVPLVVDNGECLTSDKGNV